MRLRWRSTIRVRLVLLYAGAFFLAGAVLIGLTYGYLARSLDQRLDARVGAAERHVARYADQPDTHGTSGRTSPLHDALTTQFEQDRDETLRVMLLWSVAALGSVGVLAGGFGWLLAGRALRPLQQITATARRVADRSLNERIALAGPDDEIKDLADTFDAMLERLDRSFDGQRRFVANASHELRTPLTLNRTLIEVALDDSDVPESTRRLGTRLLEVNDRNERLIDGLLVLASSEQGLTEPGLVDLAEIAGHVASRSAGAARDAGVEIRTNLATAPVMGDHVLLERLAQNLLDNGIRYNLGEHAWISITTGTAGESACLSVENTGPLVPDGDVVALFEPFRRLASTGDGLGLGLSIVRSVVHAHGGETVARSRSGGGLSVDVRIPAA